MIAPYSCDGGDLDLAEEVTSEALGLPASAPGQPGVGRILARFGGRILRKYSSGG
jgi:hypothetical protein